MTDSPPQKATIEYQSDQGDDRNAVWDGPKQTVLLSGDSLAVAFESFPEGATVDGVIATSHSTGKLYRWPPWVQNGPFCIEGPTDSKDLNQQQLVITNTEDLKANTMDPFGFEFRGTTHSQTDGGRWHVDPEVVNKPRTPDPPPSEGPAEWLGTPAQPDSLR